MSPPTTSRMLAEIREQPAVLARTLDGCEKVCRDLRDRFASAPPDLVVLLARGSSDNAAQFGRYLIEITAQIPTALAAPSIYTLYGSAPRLRNVLMVAISQSGESTDINTVLAQARQNGALTVGITNQPGSALTHIAHHTLPVLAGKEQSVAATKSYTGQMMAIYALARTLGGDINPDALRQIPQCVDEALQLEGEVARIAQRYRFMDRAICVGRGLNYGNALEWSLKLMETCQVVAQPFSAADLLHGPIAMLDASFPAFVFAPPGPTAPSILPVVERLAELRADVLLLLDKSSQIARDYNSIGLPAVPPCSAIPDLYSPIPYAVPAQLFAAHLAAVKQLDPDHPRGLSKVTKTM